MNPRQEAEKIVDMFRKIILPVSIYQMGDAAVKEASIKYVEGLMKEDDRINHPVAEERYAENLQILNELKSMSWRIL